MRISATHLPLALAFSAALTLSPGSASAQLLPGPGMTPLPGTPAPPLGPALFPGAGGLRTQPVFDSPPLGAPVEEPRRGFRIKYAYNEKELITGGAILGLTFTATTLIGSGMAFSGFGFLVAPAAAVPVIGPYPLAGFGAALGAGQGTVAGILALGVGQAIGFGLLMHGLASRKRIGIVPVCDAKNDGDSLLLTPIATPNAAGLSIGGAL